MKEVKVLIKLMKESLTIMILNLFIYIFFFNEAFKEVSNETLIVLPVIEFVLFITLLYSINADSIHHFTRINT